MIELKNLTRKFGGFTAVDRLNLMVPRGEIFGFIGPNGAGKTTTIKMIGGLIAPTQGDVVIAGFNMARDPVAAKQRIGFIPDRPFLYEKLTGMEFLRFIADLYGVPEDEFHVRAETHLQMFALLDWADELIESYSHGMKQRLIMAAALLHDPDLIVVDEPLVGLDPEGIKMVRELFRELAAAGKTIFMSTHTLKIAEDICHRIGIIHRGRLIAGGTVDELRQTAGNETGDLEEVFLRLTRAPH
ncbi:MAG: ABC transporter ATP-binding protein [Thermodesulfobacteriota bacterium]